MDIRDSISLQDVDLLTRLSQYFDSLEQHLQAGHGWFIFNAAGVRGARIGAFILSRLRDLQPTTTYYFVPWRDFSLSAYMVAVELQEIAPREEQLVGKAKREFDIATRISRDAMVKMAASDLLIVSGLRPTHRHEVLFLDQAITQRYSQRLSTILLTPYRPDDLAVAYHDVVPEQPLWDQLYERMYERSLIGV